MRAIQTQFDVVELSPEAKRWRKTLHELYSLYQFECGYHQQRVNSVEQFERELTEMLQQAHKSYRPLNFECFKLNGTYTGVAIRLNLRWFVKRIGK